MDLKSINFKAVRIDGAHPFHMDSLVVYVPTDKTDGIDRLVTKLDEATVILVTQRDALLGVTERLTQTEAKRDEVADKLKTALDELEGVKDPAGAFIQELIKDRVALETLAGKLKIDTKDKSNQDLQIAIIKSVHADFDPAGKDAVYVAARYDAAVETLDAAGESGGAAGLAGVRKAAFDAQGKETVSHRDKFKENSKLSAQGKSIE